MSLATGTVLGAYEILSPLGEGGMGEVYRARDTKLGRDVALKILPSEFALDAERVARFKREAQVLASLNDPHIAAIYGFEDAGGVHALVLELVEGPTLADRIAQGPVPLDEALPIARQIAEALEAAHEQGIIHRDLKPANIKVRADGTVKVLDFGLAKLADPGARQAGGAGRAGEAGGFELSQSPTITTPAMMTGVGTILGTAAYMSPEQAKGKPADKRSDLWAFGCLLFEMLTGKRAFEGEDVSDTLAAVLRGEPDWNALPVDVPPVFRALIRRCLDRDRRQRIGDVSGVLFVLREPTLNVATGDPAMFPTLSPLRARSQVVVAAIAVLVAAALTSSVWWTLGTSPVRTKVSRLSLFLPEGQQVASAARRSIAISPDGSHVAYVTAGTRLFVRSLADLETREIESDVGGLPVFSPDGKSLAFTTLGFTLKRTAVSGGASIRLSTIESFPFGLSWTGDRLLLSDTRRILRVPENGGNAETLVTLPNGDERVTTPQMLPDGRTVLFTLGRGLGADRWDKAQIVAQSLVTGERKVLVEGGADARYLQTGHIVYALGGVLFALPFDVRRLETRGGPVPVVEGVRRSGNVAGMAQYDVSDEGTLIYVAGPVAPSTSQQTVAIFNRKGDVEPTKLPSAAYEFPRLSPDGKRVTYGTDDGKDAVVWVYELSGARAPLRITYQGRNRFPIWSNDGVWVLFQSNRGGDLAIFRQRADGTGTAERLTKPEPGAAHVPDVWSPANDAFLFDVNKQSSYALFQFSMREKKAGPVGTVQSTNPITPALSPDGRWLAYSARTPGQPRNALYVAPFPPTDDTKYQISDDDGHHPTWGSNGKELFFIRRPGQFIVVPVSTSPSFSSGSPVELPRRFVTAGSAAVAGRTYDMDPRGDRIIGISNPTQIESPAARLNEIQVVLNWFEELKRRVPVK